MPEQKKKAARKRLTNHIYYNKKFNLKQEFY